MNKFDAISMLKQGYKLTHNLFESFEYIYMSNGDIYDEEDRLLSFIDGNGKNINFWTDRLGDQWNEGWSIFITDAEKFLYKNRHNFPDYTPTYVVHHRNEIYLPKSSHKRTNKKRK